MAGHTVILVGDRQRAYAHRLVDQAPPGYVVTVAEPKRTLDQNALLHVLVTELSIAKPQGIIKTPDGWKAAIMHAAGFQVQFETGLDGKPFPVGLKTSRLSKSECSQLIDWIYCYAAEQGIELSRIAQERDVA